MRPLNIILLILILSMFLACEEKTPDSEYPVSIQMIEGIKVVSNPDYPRDGTKRYLMEEDLSIGVADGDEAYMLNRPQDIHVSEDGTIYILDWSDVCIKVFDSTGKYLQTIGRKGQGPGEFEFLTYMALSSDGRIFIMDSVNRRIVVFAINGESLNGFRMEGTLRQMKTDDLNRLYFEKRIREESAEELPITEDFQELDVTVQIYRVDADGEGMFHLGDFIGEKDRLKRTGPEGVMSVGSQYNIVWEVDRNGLLYIGLNDEYKIDVLDQEGNKILTFEREYQPVTLVRQLDELVRKFVMPAFDPRLAWEFDDEGNLWVSYFSENEDEVVYDVFSPEGIYIKQVILPHMVREFKNGKVYSIVTTEEGFRAVKRFVLKETSDS